MAVARPKGAEYREELIWQDIQTQFAAFAAEKVKNFS
jgi:hypothetical protein